MQIGERLRRMFAPTDVAALGEVKAQPALLSPVAYQLSPYATSMFDYSGRRYNPDDLLSRKGFDIYQRMMIDEQVKAVVRFKLSAILSRGWFLEYPKESRLSEAERKRRIEIIGAGLRYMGGSFKTGLKTILRSVWQGFSITEKEHCRYEYEGKTWVGLKALMARPFDTIYFKTDDHGHIEKCLQRVSGKLDVEVPLGRVVYMVHNADLDPHYGQSDLREAYRAYFSKDMAIRFQNIYLERMAGGMVFLEPDATINISPNSAEYTAIQSLLKNMSAATGVLLPKGVKANVVHPSTTDSFKNAIEACNLAIAKSLLVPNLLGITETGQTGAYSQSQTQFEAFLWTLDEISSSLEELVTEQIMQELGRANFADGEAPCFRMKPIADSQKDSMLKQWAELVAKGAVEATDTDEKHVREMMDFPEKGTPKPAIPQVPRPLPGQAPAPESPKPAPPMDETLLPNRRLHSQHTHSHKVRMTSGEKRFQFELAKRKTESIEVASRSALKSAIKGGVGQMLESLRTLGTDALVLEALEFGPSAKSGVKRAIRDGMVESAQLGIRLAAGEVGQARKNPQGVAALAARMERIEADLREGSPLDRALAKRLEAGV